jgi:acetate---CoA ligase (ADP-forming)
MVRDLTNLLMPKSVAVIGASRTADKVGAIVLNNILQSKFSGKIYPVNPNAQIINNLPCYPDINSLPEIVDLAIIALPSVHVLETMNQIGDKRIKNVVIFSAGFKESGIEGENLEKQLYDIAQKYGINVLGPNCLGFVNNLCPINATFGQPAQLTGPLRFISQSGALAASLFDWCNSTGIGFNEFVTLGNKTVINENDILRYLLNKDLKNPTDTQRPIGLYLESISNGAEFLDLCKQITKTDPVFIIKPGKTKAAAQAMQSHTGAIAGEDSVLNAALLQSGVIHANTVEDFFDLAKAFSWEKAPMGPKVAIVSNAGGPAVISADAVVSEGLELAEFDDQVKAQLIEILPRSASILNPVDVLGDALADRIAKAVEIILQTNKAHSLVVILTPQVMTQIEKTAELIGKLSQKYQEPIFCSFMGGSLVAPGEQILNSYKIPSFRFPERAIAAIGSMYKWNKFRNLQQETIPETTESIQPDQTKINAIIKSAIDNNQKALDNLSANNIIQAAVIPTPPTIIATDINQAKSFAQNCGWPVVLKLSSPGLLHKKAIGGVVCDIWNTEALEHAWIDLQHKIIHLEPDLQKHISIQVQKEIINGVEVIVGIKHDPTFGPVLLFGAGGTLTEIIADKNIHLLPITLSEIKKLVEKSKIYSLLKGNPGEPPYALDKLYELIARLAKLAQTSLEIEQIEINPVIVTINDVWAIDTKVILKYGESKAVFVPQFHTAATVEHQILAGKYHTFIFETENSFVYNPGQFVSVKVADRRINAYSIAGSDQPNHFDLLVDTTPGGPGSKFFENLKVGDKITYLGPSGVFTLKPDDGSKHLLFLATGSGISPLRSMIESLFRQNSQIPMTLYFGLRHVSDIFWQDYFSKLEKEHPNFRFKLVLSAPDESWHGPIGHITETVITDNPDARDVSAYLCGNKMMIEQASEILINHGCPKERIYSEKF